MKSILYSDVQEARKLIKAYELQCSQAKIPVNLLKTGMKVTCPEIGFSSYYISEICGEDVLLRTSELNLDSPNFWVHYSSIRNYNLELSIALNGTSNLNIFVDLNKLSKKSRKLNPGKEYNIQYKQYLIDRFHFGDIEED